MKEEELDIDADLDSDLDDDIDADLDSDDSDPTRWYLTIYIKTC